MQVADPLEVKGQGPAGAPGTAGAPARRDRRRDARLVLVGVLAVLLVWFAFANLHEVNINFWLSTRRAPLIVVIVISGLLGAMVGRLVSRRRSRSEARRKSP